MDPLTMDLPDMDPLAMDPPTIDPSVMDPLAINPIRAMVKAIIEINTLL